MAPAARNWVLNNKWVLNKVLLMQISKLTMAKFEA
jgi:hypothetical protein